jgi:ribosome-binding factor A
MMQTDKNLRAMISPEERMGVDHMLSVMATVAEVEVSNDLQVVKVYVSILGDERGKKNAIKGLKRMEQYVRRKIGRRMSLRLTPEIRFVYDDSFERGQKVNALLDEIRAENRSKTAKKYGKEVLMTVEDVIAERGDVEEDEDVEEWAGDDDAVWDEMLEGVEGALESFDDDEDEEDEDDGSGIRIIEVYFCMVRFSFY